MPWPWRRRKSAPTPARHAVPRQGTWAKPAFPPAMVPAVDVPVQTPAQTPAVLLGFADGTQVTLAETDPHAVALRAVASILSEHRGTP